MPSIVKRDQTTEPFDPKKISAAVLKCFAACSEPPAASNANKIAAAIAKIVAKKPAIAVKEPTITVERVQDLVEVQLMNLELHEALRLFILYREEHRKLRGHVDQADAAYVREQKKYFPTELQAFQFADKYSRFNDAKGRRETWPESVARVMAFFKSSISAQMPDPWGTPIRPEEWAEMEQAMLSMDAMPSMRVLQMAGPALERCHVGVYNCAYEAQDSIVKLCEQLYILMQGTGNGFSVEGEFVSDLPKVKKQSKSAKTKHVIQDSTEGWCDALKAGLTKWFDGDDVEFDYSLIRPAGTLLKTKGGRSSGPAPLRELLTFTRSRILSKQGKRLSTLDVHDIACWTGRIVEVGGVRRSAQISLSDLDDLEMRTAKFGSFMANEPQRQSANNSAVYNEKPSAVAFMAEFLSLAQSGSGERGIFNRAGANQQIPKRRKKAQFGVNPCITGDSVVMTLDGPRTFKSLADCGADVKVFAWSAASKLPVVRWMRRPHMTGRNQEVLKVTFDSGLSIRCTPNHGFFSFRGAKVEAQDLQVGQSVRAWSMSKHRDGHLRVHAWDSANDCANHQWVARMVWECANGPVPHGYIVHHEDGDEQNNALGNLAIMTPIQHNEHHYPDRFENGLDGSSWNHKVVSVTEDGSADVYNGCVDDAHSYIVLDPTAVSGIASGVVSANCGEILLRDRQFCNLSIAIARPDDTETQLADKVRIATMFGTLQSTLTNFKYLSPEWKKNCEEERLLGVDINGQMDCELLRPTSFDRHFLLGRLKQVAVNTNKALAARLGINQSAAVTCVKPSGNSSVLFNVSPGLHPRHAAFYIRRCTVSAAGPMGQLLLAEGVPHQVSYSNTANLLFEFPCAAPPGAILKGDLSAIDQLENWATWKEYYTEHNPSVTITVKPNEWVDVGHWVYSHWDIVGGLSFLPASDTVYAQAPYEEISEAEYQRRAAAFPSVDYAKLAYYEHDDQTTVAQDFACVSGVCEIA